METRCLFARSGRAARFNDSMSERREPAFLVFGAA